jgi:hypothetical protein
VTAGTLLGVVPASAALSYGTLIAQAGGDYPDSETMIELIVPGDRVPAGSLRAGVLSFEPAEVVLSSGIPPSPEVRTSMIAVVYGEDQTLIATPYQVFMLADGTLTTGLRLVAGQELMAGNGEPTGILHVTVVQWQGGIHQIVAGGTTFDGTSDGHLLQAGGLIVGDYLLELHPGLVSASI